jgi:hypothetical protein
MLMFVFSLACMYWTVSVNVFNLTSRSFSAQLSVLPRAAYADTISDKERRKSKQTADAFDEDGCKSLPMIGQETYDFFVLARFPTFLGRFAHWGVLRPEIAGERSDSGESSTIMEDALLLLPLIFSEAGPSGVPVTCVPCRVRCERVVVGASSRAGRTLLSSKS